MVGVQSVLEGIVQTFGPFLIPVTVFAIGVVGYTVLLLLSQQFRPEPEEGVVNLSAGTPERSATDNDHGASTRGVRPYDGTNDGAERDEEEADGSGGSETGSDGGAPDGRAEDTPRHND